MAIPCDVCRAPARHGDAQYVEKTVVSRAWYCCGCFVKTFGVRATREGKECVGCVRAIDATSVPFDAPHRVHYRKWQRVGLVLGGFYAVAGVLQDAGHWYEAGRLGWPVYGAAYFALAGLGWYLCDCVARRWESEP